MTFDKRKKRKSKKKFFNKISFISLIVLIICLIFVFKFDNNYINKIKYTISFGSMKLEKIKTFDYKSNLKYVNDSNIYKIASKFFKIDNSELTQYDTDFKPIWKKELNGVNVKLVGKGNLLILYDKEIGNIYSLDVDGNIVGKILNIGKIENVIVKNEFNVIVYNSANARILILDNKCEKLSEIALRDDKISKIESSSDKSIIATTTLKIAKDKFFSTVQIYNLDGELSGLLNFDSAIIFDIKIIGDSVILLSDSWLRKYDNENNMLFEYKFDRTIKNFSFDDNGNVVLNLVAVSKDISNPIDDNIILKIDNKGNKVFEKKINVDVEKIEYNYGEICYTSDDKLYILDEKGENIGIQLLSSDIINVKWFSSSKLGVYYINKFEYYLLK
ncbi:DUF5711 family protein [Helicovermis profundi]|uniref:Uncharacterized protein n=1 Tax=Helicovermis profundi TaxID=3065157 RepID=A0AAU9EQG3_9FIRM|nr:hypothetical protein HLPR_27500 [Clostridia bacterium S502]